MTMPNERLRALRWGRELLELLAKDEALSPVVREQAQRLLPAYPMRGQLERLVAEGAHFIPADAAVALLGSLRRAAPALDPANHVKCNSTPKPPCCLSR